MKLCRLPVAVVCLLVVISTAGWMVRAVQAARIYACAPVLELSFYLS